MKNNDADAINDLLHDDLLFIIPTGQTINKVMDLANIRSKNLRITDISSSELLINLIGDNAIVCAHLEVTGSCFNQLIEGRFRYIRVWNLVVANWKVIGGSAIQLSS